MVYQGGSPSYQIRELSITRGSAITATDVMNTAGADAGSIHSLTHVVDGAARYLVCVKFEEKTDTTGYDLTHCHSYRVDTGLPINEQDRVRNTDLPDPTHLIVDVLDFSGTLSRLLYIKSLPSWVNKFPSYQIAHYDTGTATEVIRDSSSAYFVPVRNQHSTHAFYVDGGSGSVKKILPWTGGPIVIDGGQAPVFDAPFAMDIRIGSNASDPDIWGISAPSYHPDTQETTPDGKYYLWSYGSKHTGRVPLMDFDGMDKWDAIAALPDAHHHRVHFNRDGNFVCEPRNPTALGSGEIATDKYLDGWDSIVRDGETDVQNFIEITPYISRLRPIETVLHLRPDSPWDGNVLGSQLDRLERRVHLRCINGGKISDDVTRWAWRPFFSSVRTSLAAAYSGGTTVVVESSKDIAVGDAIRIQGSGERTVTIIAGSTLTISSAFSGTYPRLSGVQVTQLRNGRWSSEGVTLLNGAINNSVTSITVDSTSDIAAGNRLIIEGEELTVSSVDSSTTLTVTRGVNATSHPDNASVAAIIRPTALDTWYEVGGQKINVRWKKGPTEQLFRVGDYIEFLCGGLVLEEQKEAIVQYMDDTSIAKYGKSQMTHRINNRFMDFLGAQRKAADLGARGATPKRKFQVTKGLDFQYGLLGSFFLKSKSFFPDQTDNRARVIVRTVSYQAGKVTYAVEAE